VTLHLLGDPNYIQLLVNPQSGLIAVRKCTSKGYCTHHIRPQFFTSDNCYELTSKILLENLRTLNTQWNTHQSYRIAGTFNKKEGIVQFALKDSILIEDTECREQGNNYE
jgi:hypothetical protein